MRYLSFYIKSELSRKRMCARLSFANKDLMLYKKSAGACRVGLNAT